MILLSVLYWFFDYHEVRSASIRPLLWLGQNALLVYCLSQFLVLVLDLLYVGLPSYQISLLSLLRNHLFGEYWDVIGLSLWPDPRWPSLYWALLNLTAWTAFIGLLTWSRSSGKSLLRSAVRNQWPGASGQEPVNKLAVASWQR